MGEVPCEDGSDFWGFMMMQRESRDKYVSWGLVGLPDLDHGCQGDGMMCSVGCTDSGPAWLKGDGVVVVVFAVVALGCCCCCCC